LVSHIGEEVILAINKDSSGDVYVFDRNGTGIRRINRKGQGPEEYSGQIRATLDETNGDMYVVCTYLNKVMVYDLYGTFKRSLPNVSVIITNFDRDHLLCAIPNEDPGNDSRIKFVIISKHDGSVTKEIQIPFKDKKVSWAFNGGKMIIGPTNQILVPNRDSWLLAEISSDTIYQLMPDYRMVPFMARIPSVQSMNPEAFLYPSVITDRYCFMQTVFKIETRTETGERKYPRHDIVYDKKEKSLFEYIVYNDDFSKKRPVSLAFESLQYMTFMNKEIAFIYKFESYELVEAYKKGQLKGKLKEIAAKLNEESNPVIMVAKHKK